MQEAPRNMFIKNIVFLRSHENNDYFFKTAARKDGKILYDKPAHTGRLLHRFGRARTGRAESEKSESASSRNRRPAAELL